MFYKFPRVHCQFLTVGNFRLGIFVLKKVASKFSTLSLASVCNLWIDFPESLGFLSPVDFCFYSAFVFYLVFQETNKPLYL